MAISESILIKNVRDFFKLYDIMDRETIEVDHDVIIEKSSLDTFEILILAGFFIHRLQKNSKPTLDASDPQIKEYIESIGLKNFCEANHKNSNTIEFIEKHSAMPIKRLSREKMNEYIDLTQRYFQGFCPDKDLGMVNTVLAELINNVHDHASSELGAYVFAQYDPSEMLIKLAVADFGIGIPHSVNTYRLKDEKSILSEIDTIKWAIKENKTTKSIPQNMGKGLDLVKSFVKSSENSWSLYSNEVLLRGNKHGNRYFENPIYSFKGTIIQIEVNVNNLTDKTMIDEFDW